MASSSKIPSLAMPRAADRKVIQDMRSVNIHEIGNELVKFYERDFNDVLSLKLIKIKEIVHKSGEIIYPILKY